jgi:hypothetical protein
MKMGVSWLDVVVSLLKFEGFATEKLLGKVWRIVTYPLVLLLAILFAILFIIVTIVVKIKSR